MGLSAVDIENVKSLALQAGACILKHYKSETLAPTYKSDHSPLTIADEEANHIIVAGLKALKPDIPVISEEDEVADFATRTKWPQFWLVDPLDGTKEFIKQTDEFTVNIALLVNNKPVFGLVYAPAKDELYYCGADNAAYKSTNTNPPKKISVRAFKEDRAIILTSRSHKTREDQALAIGSSPFTVKAVGSSLKFCRIAEGSADLYVRSGICAEWDTAAGHAILEASGGTMTDLSGAIFKYNKPSILNPPFICYGDRLVGTSALLAAIKTRLQKQPIDE